MDLFIIDAPRNKLINKTIKANSQADLYVVHLIEDSFHILLFHKFRVPREPYDTIVFCML